MTIMTIGEAHELMTNAGVEQKMWFMPRVPLGSIDPTRPDMRDTPLSDYCFLRIEEPPHRNKLVYPVPIFEKEEDYGKYIELVSIELSLAVPEKMTYMHTVSSEPDLCRRTKSVMFTSPRAITIQEGSIYSQCYFSANGVKITSSSVWENGALIPYLGSEYVPPWSHAMRIPPHMYKNPSNKKEWDQFPYLELVGEYYWSDDLFFMHEYPAYMAVRFEDDCWVWVDKGSFCDNPPKRFENEIYSMRISEK